MMRATIHHKFIVIWTLRNTEEFPSYACTRKVPLVIYKGQNVWLHKTIAVHNTEIENKVASKPANNP